MIIKDVLLMRVITGSARGAKLETPDGLETRPTAEAVKEAVFSMLQFELEGRRVLDLFAGGGQLGIEALSRGAAYAVFVDSGKKAAECIKKNLEHTGLSRRAKVVCGDCFGYLPRAGEKFDIVLLDPPYGQDLAAKALEGAAAITDPEGVIVCQTSRNDAMPEKAGDFTMTVNRRYGKTAVRLYRHAGYLER